MDWDKLKSFHAAAEMGSLTAAGERLGISQSAVSRQISALEENLSVFLFQRHARGLVLTNECHTLYQSTLEMASAANSAIAALRDQHDNPQGELTVTVPVAFGATWLVPRLGEFIRRYPDLRLNLRLDDREYDLLKLEAECAIRLMPADKADLIQRRLKTLKTSLYASQAYLDMFGEPQTAQDLDDHAIITFGEMGSGTTYTDPLDQANWAARIGRDDAPPRVPALKVNNVFAMLRAVAAGLGVADLPDYMVTPEQKLKRILTDVPGPSYDLYFIYPSDLRRSKRVAVFRDFVTEEIARM